MLHAPLKQGSLNVAVGDEVEAGQVVAAMGDSGNRGMPHLHVQVQDRPAFDAGATTFPIATFPIELEGAPDIRRGDRFVEVRRDDRITATDRAR